MNKEHLCEELPYWEFMESPKGHVILMDGSMVAGLNVSLMGIECLEDAQVNRFTEGLRNALNCVSENVYLQFHFSIRGDYSDVLGRVKDPTDTLMKQLSAERLKRLEVSQERGELMRPSLTVYIRTPMVEKKRFAFFKSSKMFSVDAKNNYEETFQVLLENIQNLETSFRKLGLSAETLEKDRLIENVYTFFNPKRSKDQACPSLVESKDADHEADVIHDNEWLANPSPRSQLVFGDLVLDHHQITLDSIYHRLITLKTMPEVTISGQMSSFLKMNFPYDLLVSVHVPPQADEMAKLQQKRKMAHSLAVTEGAKASDLESETKLGAAEELIRELLSTGQRIYSAQVSVILKATASDEGKKLLNRQSREVLSAFRALNGSEGLEESVGTWPILKGNFVAAPIRLERARKMKTNNLADFLPVYGSYEGDDDPIVLFRNRQQGLVSYNPFDPKLPNYNSLVTGSSGAGKSFLNNCILLQELSRPMKVFIIDIGGSYKKLTEALGGQYVEVNLSDQYNINPFFLTSTKDKVSSQKIKSLLAILESMVSDGESDKLGKLDKVLLEKSLLGLYDSCRAQERLPTLSDLALVLSKDAESSMQRMAKMLYLWTGDRPYGKLLDGQGTLRTDARVCTFDLKGLSQYPDLQAVMILILTDFILSQVEQDRSVKKRIILDEAWELLKSPASAQFMEYCARTLRKTGSGITFITQAVDDIASSSIGSAILNNTATKFVMLQRGDSSILRDTLKLNQRELALVGSLSQQKGEYSEGFMMEGDHRQVIRIYPTPLEYWLATSDAQDNRYLETLVSTEPNLLKRIELAAESFPKGIAAKEGK